MHPHHLHQLNSTYLLGFPAKNKLSFRIVSGSHCKTVGRTDFQTIYASTVIGWFSEQTRRTAWQLLHQEEQERLSPRNQRREPAYGLDMQLSRTWLLGDGSSANYSKMCMHVKELRLVRMKGNHYSKGTLNELRSKFILCVTFRQVFFSLAINIFLYRQSIFRIWNQFYCPLL